MRLGCCLLMVAKLCSSLIRGIVCIHLLLFERIFRELEGQQRLLEQRRGIIGTEHLGCQAFHVPAQMSVQRRGLYLGQSTQPARFGVKSIQ